MAAFSSRGPADDGRIKPDIVAPGTFILSARSHDPAVSDLNYWDTYNANYAYLGGTSMATPLTAGAAALAREWLVEQRGFSNPSAALMKAVLLNGASNISPGQYGTGSALEIPLNVPNSVSGWGRANLLESVNPSAPRQIWLQDTTTGLRTGGQITYTIPVGAAAEQAAQEGEATFSPESAGPLRITLAWTDYPGSTSASKALVNDLDLEVVAPNGTHYYGNFGLYSTGQCLRQISTTVKWDTCNNVEGVLIPNAVYGNYTVIVRGYNIPNGPQPFAVVASGDNLLRMDKRVFLPFLRRK